jgi:hypothetical protein
MIDIRKDEDEYSSEAGSELPLGFRVQVGGRTSIIRISQQFGHDIAIPILLVCLPRSLSVTGKPVNAWEAVSPRLVYADPMGLYRHLQVLSAVSGHGLIPIRNMSFKRRPPC